MVIAKVSKSRGWERSGHLFDEALEEVEDNGGRPRDCNRGHERREEQDGVRSGDGAAVGALT